MILQSTLQYIKIRNIKIRNHSNKPGKFSFNLFLTGRCGNPVVRSCLALVTPVRQQQQIYYEENSCEAVGTRSLLHFHTCLPISQRMVGFQRERDEIYQRRRNINMRVQKNFHRGECMVYFLHTYLPPLAISQRIVSY